MNKSYCNRPVISLLIAPARLWFRDWLALLAACIIGSAAALAVAPAAPTVLVVGDSISAGYGLPKGEGWVDLLQRKLAAQGFRHKVVNASVTGDTTAGGRSRIGAALERNKPEIVIIELGGNDGLRGSALAPMKANLDFMVEAAQKAGAKVLLLGMQLPPNYGKKYIAQFAAVFGEVAQSRHAALVPFIFQGFADQLELFQPDHIHPGAQAQPLMLDLVWSELRKLLA